MAKGAIEMHGYLPRMAETQVMKGLRRFPAVAILGPRQCGKSTLARHALAGMDAVVLDLQDRGDRSKLNEPELFLERHRGRLVCLDEIQRTPDLFPVLRSEIDRDRRPGRFLILGSASRDLIRQSSETLAGRIHYIELTPFLVPEARGALDWRTHWLRGGFPPSALAENDDASFDWRVDFVRTFLERDVPTLGFSIPAPVMERLWRLLAHFHGQLVNLSKIAEAAELSVPTLKKHLALLEQTYMIRLLPPRESNAKKRFVKSSKVYLRDHGILHSLLDIETYDRLLAHPQCGASWEGRGIESIVAAMPRYRPSFARTSNGAELDLVMERGGEVEVFEFKLSRSPKPSRGFFELVRDISPVRAWIIAPVDEPYAYAEGVEVASPEHALSRAGRESG
jgi:predicted AAA+ superfamily ATPase